jgi:hypothetical protein
MLFRGERERARVRKRECVRDRARARARERETEGEGERDRGREREREIKSQGHTVSSPDVGIEILRHIRYRSGVLCASVNGGWGVVCCKRVWEG